jgi:hypothetical protein
MNRRVLKHSVPVDDQWHEIPNHQVLHVACQTSPGSVEVWVIDYGYPDAPTMRVRIFGTGQPLPDRADWVATTLTADGALVWHLFRAVEPLDVDAAESSIEPVGESPC